MFDVDWGNLTNWSAIITPERLAGLLRALFVLVVGFSLLAIVTRAMRHWTASRTGGRQDLLTNKILRGVLFAIVVLTALDQLGVKLGVVMGAAGVVSVALGFASQTAASNLISGLFLMVERPFAIGDVLRLSSDLTGEVLSIDALSVKLRTFDNLYVRVPNEDLIKSRFTNISHFPIRRVDLQIGVAYKEDTQQIHDLLNQIADDNPLCMTEPEPLFLFLGYGDSALLYQFSVWGQRSRFITLRNSMYQDIKKAFDERGIEIPFPHLSFYTGSETDPLPIRLLKEEEPA
jgi:small-conductance mechanosensitive channel